jgi:hypothetical protein
MTPGQIAYEQDCKAKPFYGSVSGHLTPRRKWHELPDFIKATWEKNPTPRWIPQTNGDQNGAAD